MVTLAWKNLPIHQGSLWLKKLHQGSLKKKEASHRYLLPAGFFAWWRKKTALHIFLVSNEIISHTIICELYEQWISWRIVIPSNWQETTFLSYKKLQNQNYWKHNKFKKLFKKWIEITNEPSIICCHYTKYSTQIIPIII